MLLGLAGLIISMLVGMKDHISFLQFLCTTACRDTSEMGLFQVPFWIWGGAFYAVVTVLALFRRDWVPWVVAPAVGAEAAFIWTMIEMKAPCVFCIANAVVVAILLAVAFRKTLFWQQSTLALVFLLLFSQWIPYSNPPEVHEAKPVSNTESGVAARVGDEAITDLRLEVLLGSKLVEMRRDEYRMKIDRLNQLIVDTILEKEAKAEGKSIEDFVNDAAPLHLFPIDDAEIAKYLEENADRVRDWRGNIAELRDRVRQFLQQQKRAKALNAYAHSLEPKYGVVVNIPYPQPPNVKVDVQGAPTLGPADAPVSIVEFSDYECPACRATHDVVKKVRETYGDKIRWYFKDYPLKRHKDAFKAAEAAHCADAQGKFWQYQEKLFTAKDLSVESMIKLAGEMGMSEDTFKQCLQDSKYKSLVEKNLSDVVQAGVDRTPAFIINGMVFTGGPAFETFQTAIDQELKKMAKNQ